MPCSLTDNDPIPKARVGKCQTGLPGGNNVCMARLFPVFWDSHDSAIMISANEKTRRIHNVRSHIAFTACSRSQRRRRHQPASLRKRRLGTPASVFLFCSARREDRGGSGGGSGPFYSFACRRHRYTGWSKWSECDCEAGIQQSTRRRLTSACPVCAALFKHARQGSLMKAPGRRGHKRCWRVCRREIVFVFIKPSYAY
jgi:hypothetical protein